MSSEILFQTDDGLTKIETTFDDDIVWLFIDKMAELYQRGRSVIGKHAKNILIKSKLEKISMGKICLH